MSETRTIRTTLNGDERLIEIRANQTLLDLVRDELSLTGSVEGCGVGVCGSCTVLVDDAPVSSCLTLATNVEGRTVTTIEGLAVDGTLHRVQQAFLEQQAFQCGFCTPGMIMAVTGLLREHPNASEEEARDYLSGNLCRCGTYQEVLAAVESLTGWDQREERPHDGG